MSLFKFKNKINSHVVFNNTVKQIVKEIQKIPKYNDLKGNHKFWVWDAMVEHHGSLKRKT